jgi:predicted SPOUT superfamily RNA methylase MTH1
MIYTPKIKSQVKSIPVPADFVMDILEYDFIPPYLGLRFYESHWRHMSEKERLKCIDYMQKVKKIIESYGISVTLDPVYDVPGGQKLR